MYLGENIKYLRKKAGMTQRDLSVMLNYTSSTTIQKWESGSIYPPVPTVMKLSEIFNVSMDDLLYNDFKTSPPLPRLNPSFNDELINHFAASSDEVKNIICMILKIETPLLYPPHKI